MLSIIMYNLYITYRTRISMDSYCGLLNGSPRKKNTVKLIQVDYASTSGPISLHQEDVTVGLLHQPERLVIKDADAHQYVDSFIQRNACCSTAGLRRIASWSANGQEAGGCFQKQ